MKNFEVIARKIRVIKRHTKAAQKENRAEVTKMMDAVGKPEFWKLMPAPSLNFKKAQ